MNKIKIIISAFILLTIVVIAIIIFNSRYTNIKLCGDDIACWNQKLIVCTPNARNEIKLCDKWIGDVCSGKSFTENHTIKGLDGNLCIVEQDLYKFYPEKDKIEYSKLTCKYNKGIRVSCEGYDNVTVIQ